MKEGGRDATTATTTRPANKSSVGVLLRLKNFAFQYWCWMVFTLCALIASSFFTLSVPLVLRGIVDGTLGIHSSLEYFTIFIALAAALGSATAFRSFCGSTFSEKVVFDIRAQTFRHILGMSSAFFDDVHSGELTSRLTTDIAVIQSVLSRTLPVILRNILLVLGGTTMMIVTSPKLALAGILVVPAAIFPVIVLGRKVRQHAKKAQDNTALASAFVSENLKSVQIIQAYTAEKTVERSFLNHMTAVYKAEHFYFYTRAILIAFAIFAILLAIATVLWIGNTHVTRGDISAGELGQFLLYALLSASAMSSLAESWSDILKAAGASERLWQILDTQSEVISSPDTESLSNSDAVLKNQILLEKISFKNVNFSYSCGKGLTYPALHNVTFTIEPGETVALVGPAGSGKSTIFKLLMNFYNVNSGAIYLGGVNIKKINLTTLRNNFSLVSQDIQIFSDTIFNNILFGKPTASREEVILAAKLSSSTPFIDQMPLGFDTCVGEQGVRLSGGQKQKLAFARAILRDAPVLLLDEATASLDSESETVMQDAIKNLAKNKTTFTIAHRLSTVKQASWIIVFDGGRIVEIGTHNQLISHDGGLYARLADLQFVK